MRGTSMLYAEIVLIAVQRLVSRIKELYLKYVIENRFEPRGCPY